MRLSDSERAQVGTLAELLDCLDDGRGGAQLVFPESTERLAHRDVRARAWGVSEALLRAGVEPGGLVGILARTGPETPAALFGAWAAGAAISVLPVPPLALDPARLAQRLTPIAQRLTHLLVDSSLLPVAEALSGLCPRLRVIPLARCAPAPRPARVQPPAPSDTAIVQFTSGSTARPKGVQLSHAAVLHCCASTVQASGVHAEDVLIAWVPLFHDFGLITLIIGFWLGFEEHLFSPRRFISAPAEVVRYLGDNGGTLFGGPNFAYDRIIEAVGDGGTGSRELARWRMAMNGGEPVKPGTATAFAATMGRHGVPRGAMLPVYGMAEATMSVACSTPGAEPRMAWLDRRALIDHGEAVAGRPDSAGSTGLVSVGAPVPGLALRLVDAACAPVSDGRVGEIEIRGPSVTSGYLDDPEASAAAFRDGWLRTGDLGVRIDGELYVAGRRKDMIVVAGRNFFAEDVEDVVRPLAGVYRRRCVAVSDPEAERIVIVAETEDTAAGPALGIRIRAAVTSALELDAVDVQLVPPGTLPRTTSGKWQRALTARYLRSLKGTAAS